jgi:serine/threonine protein kinase
VSAVSTKLEFSRGELIAEKYEVVDFLDENPLGFTYRAKQVKAGKYVRLLLLRPGVAGRGQREKILEAFRTTRELTHPNLARVGELGEHDGIAYVTLEDFDGGTLRELLQEHRINGQPFALKEAAQICIQVLEGLDAMHQQGIVMRALRPEYVLINVRYTGPRKQTFVATIKLFGGALWELVPTAVLTEDEFSRGEAQYIAPELKSIDPMASPRSDVFSAGVIFYEMLVGAVPAGSFQLPTVKRPDLPEHVNTVAELALAQAPDDRYPSCSDFMTDLQRAFQDEFSPRAGGGRPLITPIGWGLGLVFVVFVGIILFTMFPSDDTQRDELADAALREQVYQELTQSTPTGDEFQAIYERHPPNMVYVPPGPYIAGRMRTDPNAVSSEPMAHRRETDGYLIDIFEFPNLKGSPPRFEVTQREAAQLCEQAGKRLCTAEEWERACKGMISQNYAYGNAWDPEFCGAGLSDAYPSGTMEKCKSQYGVVDQSGNFREWTGTATKPGRVVVKGGQKGQPEKGTRCAYAEVESDSYTDKSLSFRCCRDVDPPPVEPGRN